MSMQFKISPMILKSIATLYLSVFMVIQEFLSNALDAAEAFFDLKNNSYTKLIEITITIENKTRDLARVIIQDNVTGIKNLTGLLSRIGNSSKINDEASAGCFGVGIFAFIAICNIMIITTRLSNSDTINRLELNSRMFESREFENQNIVEQKENISSYQLGSPHEDCWTIVKLEDFFKHSYKELNAKELKSEIEKHFELILRRKNIQVKIIANGQKEYICMPYDYDKIDGEEYIKKLDYLEKYKSKKYRSKEVVKIKSPVIIYLKVSKGRILQRRPVFIIKGRRIAEISDVKAFRTASKGSIWSHPNVTGYIDVTGVLEPKISRDDFKSTPLQKALFQTLVSLEPDIKEFISRNLSMPSSKEFKGLENILSDTIRRLNKTINFRRLIEGDNIKNRIEKTDDDFNSIKSFKLKALRKTKSESDLKFSGQERKVEDTDKSIPRSSATTDTPEKDSERPVNNSVSQHNSVVNAEVKQISVDITEGSTPLTGQGKRTTSTESDKLSDLKILIDSENNPPFDITNTPVRSSFIENKIIIYKKHSMFIERIKNNEQGVKVVSSELISYLATEIVTQIRIMVYSEKKNEIKDVSSFIYQLTEGVHILTSELTKFVGKNLNELINLN